ncbi:hypothetical protein SAR116_1713 [Candidatus Puniceispirillum marinum IMCC1322]|uniref:DUF1116 domain-containing protein n=2 Tax=Candidatus Puniceispirillum TaxID=767891 RepID=D5BUK9_PUNMI|nr:hypothetical protein SAR116_1713 [Candidatus Puniceispirillum marinum IMCC1322]
MGMKNSDSHQSMTQHKADIFAFDRLSVVQPFWTGFDTAANHAGLDDNVFLHAGPAFSSVESICKPILNSAAVGAVFEGIADNLDQAINMLMAGEIELRPAQDYGVVTPLAGVVTPHMPLHYVYDGNHGRTVCLTPINGGNGAAMRLGQCSDAAVAHMRWINGPVLDCLAAGLGEGLELIPFASAGLAEGDDCHGRTIAATQFLVNEIDSRSKGGIANEEVRAFLNQSPSMFLNLWMAASKCIMMAATGIDGSSMITAMGSNGVDVGLQVAGLPGLWFTAPAAPPNGHITDGLDETRKLGAIGDSAVVEALGLGAMNITHSPEQMKALGNFLPADFADRITALRGCEHFDFTVAKPPIGITARSVHDYGAAMVIALGIIDSKGELGRIGGGIFDPPMAAFNSALSALEDAK